ncbi:MAG: ATPase, T2SS/T4P/T4SS family [Spirulina sp.]
MAEKRSLSEFTLEKFIALDAARAIVLNILAGQPGLFTVTGQPSTGKTTTLLVLAQQAWLQGIPVTLLTSDQDLLDQIHLSLPSEWIVQYVTATEDAWEEAVQEYILAHPGMALVTDQLVGFNNSTAAMMAAKAGHWVFACLDTPFVGLDVLYVLRALGYATVDLVDNLVGILSQMLLPTLCTDCGRLAPATLAETVLVYPDSDKPRDLWREVGCPTCGHRGVGGGRQYGRCALFEVLQIDDAVKPLVDAYLEHGIVGQPPSQQHFTLRDHSRDLVKQGTIGIQTYQRTVLQNPLLRNQHFWEQESFRAERIQGMFGRFVTQQLVDKLMHQSDFDRIIEGERREVTCFFCDVRGFTRRAEQSSAVDLFSTLNRYFREIIDIVFQYQGTIDKFIGDSVMVVFG